MRYTGSVSNAFVQSMAHNFEQALRLMEAALTDCPDDLWQTDLWPHEAPTAPAPHARNGLNLGRFPSKETTIASSLVNLGDPGDSSLNPLKTREIELLRMYCNIQTKYIYY